MSTDLHAVYTNGFSIKVDEGPSRVAKCDGGVGLNILWHVPALESHLARGSRLVTDHLEYWKFGNAIFESDLTPAVIVLESESGDPRATTHSPGRRSSLLPSRITGSARRGEMRTVARSDFMSTSSTIP